jgi:hypothetical protein
MVFRRAENAGRKQRVNPRKSTRRAQRLFDLETPLLGALPLRDAKEWCLQPPHGCKAKRPPAATGKSLARAAQHPHSPRTGGAIGAVASADALHALGRGFESLIAHQFPPRTDASTASRKPAAHETSLQLPEHVAHLCGLLVILLLDRQRKVFLQLLALRHRAVFPQLLGPLA